MDIRGPRFLMWLALALSLVSVLTLGAVGQASAATVIYVKYDASGLNNGTSWTNAYKSLQKALSVAVSGQQIWVAKGTYKRTTGTDRSLSFVLKSGVAVYGGFTGTETSLSQRNFVLNVTILSGDIGTVGDASDNSYHVVTATGLTSASLLDGFTLTGGNANSLPSPNFEGGGMYIFTTNLTLRNLIIKNNIAFIGGGMAVDTGSNPTLTNVQFVGNSTGVANYGGGMYIAAASPTLSNVTFSANSSGNGGAMYNLGGSTPTLTKVTFSGNWASTDGGGMYNASNSNPTLTNVVFKGNYTTLSGSGGGGMYNNSSSPALIHVTFSTNAAYQNGGGMENDSSSKPKLTYVTFSGNSAGGSGAGMFNTGSSPTLTRVTFTKNIATVSGGGMYNISSNPTLTYVTFTGNSATNNDGGGMGNSSSSPALTNVAFVGNKADGYGGGMYNLSSSPKLTNITFSGNSTSSRGGGIENNQSNPTVKNATFSSNTSNYGGGMYNDASSPVLTNLTFNGNTAGFGGDGMYNSGGSVSIYDSLFWGDGSVEISNNSPASTIADSVVEGGCPTGMTCSGNIFNLDPKLGSLQNNGGFTKTMALGLGSAAIDAGNNSTCTKKDQRGVVRPQGLTCDVGAYEVRVMSFPSQGVNDGWVLESSETSGVGGSLNSAGTAIRVGDDASNRQYRSVLSFNTAGLPDTATVVRGVIKVKRAALTGTDPFSTLGSLVLDVKKPYFGSLVGLEISDFQASATASSAGGIGPLMLSGWYWGLMSGSGDAAVNKTGTTQLRLRFSLDDNNNHVADYLSLYSGNATAAYQPRLMVYYNP